MADQDAFGPTMAPGALAPASPAPDLRATISTRTTVLPRDPSRPTVTHDGPRYVPLRTLGVGGVGEVVLHRDHDIDRPVAIKRLRPEQANAGLPRFVREIRTVGQLEHPNIAPIHDVGVDDTGSPYFVMRYVEGDTLEAIISRLAAGDRATHATYTFERRAQLFLGVLNALNFAHARCYLHRDLKPANIMVGAYGEVFVMDWGVARRLDAPGAADAAPAPTADTLDAAGDDLFRTRHGTLIGTPAYMSPEQAAGRVDELDARSDVYSAAVVFYELLTLRHYLPGRTTMSELLAAVQRDAHVVAHHLPPHPHQPAVPAELGWFLEPALAKDPAARYPSIAAMIDALQATLAGGFDARCAVTFLKKNGGRALRFVDAHPRISIGLLAGLGALLVAGVAALGVVLLS